MHGLLALCLILLMPASAGAQNVRVEWTWLPSPNAFEFENVDYLPYVCSGICDESGPWMDERDAVNKRVVFDGSTSCDGITGYCLGSYQAYWPYGQTWSFALTARSPNGAESVRSNIVSKSHLPPGVATTTTTAVPKIPEPPTVEAISIDED